MRTSLRSIMKRCCQGCAYWQGYGPPPPGVNPADWVGGECRKKAPGKYHVVRVVPARLGDFLITETVEVPFPPMPPDGWCGEYAPGVTAEPVTPPTVVCPSAPTRPAG
jgi:hypothetical protein